MSNSTFAEPKPATQSKSSSSRGWFFGCFGCATILIGVPLLLILAGYFILFHTSVPFQMVAGENFDFNGNPVEINGVSGSISSGFEIEEVVVHGEDQDSRIEGLTLHYNGIWDTVSNERIVIEELSADKAEFHVGNDFFSFVNSGDSEDHSDFDYDDVEFDSDGGDMSGLFELKELNFKNTTLRSDDGHIDIDIPLIRIAGLKIEGDDFDLQELEIQSNCLNMQLVDATPDSLDGIELPFKRKIIGNVLPQIHASVKSPIDFSVELGAKNGSTVSRLTAFNGEFQSCSLPGGDTVVQFTDFLPERFLDPGSFVVPEQLNMNARISKDGRVAVSEGSFKIGLTEFAIPEQEVDENDPDAKIVSSGTAGNTDVTASMVLLEDQVWPPFRVHLESEQTMNPKELFANVYYHRPFEELAEDEQQKVKSLASQMNSDTK